MIPKRLALGVVLISIGIVGILVFGLSPSRAYSMDQASTLAQRYLASLNNPDLAIDEIMEFEQNFYIIYYEKPTGIGAFEMLIDKTTGCIFPEYGPNMMWNTKYSHGGMMSGWRKPSFGQMLISKDEAVSIAQRFLEGLYAGTLAEDPHPFYGYYTIHVTKDGRIYGMLSVNGYNGSVWYHNWHGRYIKSRGMH